MKICSRGLVGGKGGVVRTMCTFAAVAPMAAFAKHVPDRLEFLTFNKRSFLDWYAWPLIPLVSSSVKN